MHGAMKLGKYLWKGAYERRQRLNQRFPAWKASDCPEMVGDNKDKRCVKCGTALTGRQLRWCSGECVTWFLQNHVFSSARRAIQSSATDCALCGEPLGADIEVDHIEPALGRHGLKSCIHHLTNLRALHSQCHRERTRSMRQ